MTFKGMRVHIKLGCFNRYVCMYICLVTYLFIYDNKLIFYENIFLYLYPLKKNIYI